MNKGPDDQKVELLRMSSLGATIFNVRVQGPREAHERAAVAEDLLFGTRLFVCAKNWVLRHRRSLNAHEGPWAG